MFSAAALFADVYKRQLLRRNTFIGDCYNEFQERKDAPTRLRVMMRCV